ncbi:MAG TPA: MFS transporter [Jatrophihabitantaceae bacterium]
MRRSALTMVCLTVFVDLIGFTLVLPGLPFAAKHLGATGFGVGLAMSAYSMAQFVSAPALGRIADRYGRRRVLLASLVGSVVSLSALAAAPTLGWLVLARLVAGAAGGSIGVGQALVADLTPPERHARAFGLVGASIGSAFVVGPAVGAALARLGFAGSAAVGAGLAAVNLVAAVRWLPDAAPRAVISEPARSDGQLPVLAATLLSMLAFAGMEGTFALLAHHRFGSGPALIGVVLTIAGVVLVAAQAGVVARIVDRIGPHGGALGGLLALAVGLVLLPVAPLLGCIGAVCLLAFGDGLFSVASTTLLTRNTPGQARGRVLGRVQSATALGRALGPAGAGALFDHGTGLPYVVGALAVLLGMAGLTATVGEPAKEIDRAATG